MVLYLTENIIEEAVSGNAVVDAIDNRTAVLINYADENASHTGRRYIEPYVYGLTKAGNPCIRAYQYWGDTKRGVPKWKLFRLDRIKTWEPTEETFELEPQARGWAAQAYNNNDGSMSEVFKTVELGEEPLTDYEKMKARTKSIKARKPLNINDINKTTIDQSKDQPSQSGPIEKPEHNEDGTQSPPPINPTINNKSPQSDQSGPIVGNASNPEENKADDLMSNDSFRKMLQHNLELTQKEKQRKRSGKTNSPQIAQGVERGKQPIKQPSNIDGPIVGNASNPEENKADDLMSNDSFRKMLQRNLELTKKEKQGRGKI